MNFYKILIKVPFLLHLQREEKRFQGNVRKDLSSMFAFRQEQEARRQEELQRQLERQRKMEQEREEQRRKMMEQREVGSCCFFFFKVTKKGPFILSDRYILLP